MLKVLELFAGIGACSKALTNLGIDHEIVDAVEINKYAIAAFNAIHGTNFEPQDITKWDKDVECDLIMHGSPCQDFSVAGLNAGGDEGSGTRSSLLYETLRIVEKVRPKYVIWENVKNLLSAKHRHNHDNYCKRMEELGYRNYYQVLNAKDYGVPQNRERVFTVSVRIDYMPICYHFPEPVPLVRKLKDVLEQNVDEKYYLSDEQAKRLKNTTYNMSKEEVRVQNPEGVSRTLCARDWKDPKCVKVGELDIKGQDQIKRVYSKEGISPTLSTMQGGNRQPKIVEPFIVASRGRNPDNPSDRTLGATTEQRLEPKFDGTTNTLTSVQKDNYVAIKTANTKGYDFATDGDGIDLGYPDSKTRRGRVGHGVCKTMPTSDSQGVLDGFRIRKLTPKECYRLMGFDDEDYDKAAAVISKTQLYKTAGNSIVVNVLEAILSELFVWK